MVLSRVTVCAIPVASTVRVVCHVLVTLERKQSRAMVKSLFCCAVCRAFVERDIESRLQCTQREGVLPLHMSRVAYVGHRCGFWFSILGVT